MFNCNLLFFCFIIVKSFTINIPVKNITYDMVNAKNSPIKNKCYLKNKNKI